MSQSVENAGGTQITAKRCPKCKSIIENNVRYGNIIKKQFNDVLGIRKKIYGNSQAQKRAQNLIAQKIQRLGNQDCQFDDVKESLERKIFEMRQKNTKHGRTMVLELINVSSAMYFSHITAKLKISRILNNKGGPIYLRKLTQYGIMVGRG